MNKQPYLTLVFIFFSLLGFSQKKDSGYFIMGNLKYSRGVNTNTTPYDNSQVQQNLKILSVSKTYSFGVSPSIIKKTKRGNLREFELNYLGFRNEDKLGESTFRNPNTNKLDIMPVYGSKNIAFDIYIKHRYHLNFFKKSKRKYYFGLNFANSIGFSSLRFIPYVTNVSFPRNQKTLESVFEIGYGGGYFINNKFLISYRSSFLTTSFQYIKQFIDNPFLPEIQRKQTFFNLNEQINVGFIPSNIVLSVAYKF